MGFGLIFMGFLMLFGMRVIPSGILGGLLMLSGLLKLVPYGEDFKRAKNACICLLVYFLLFGTAWTMSIMGIIDFAGYGTALVADEIIYYSVLIVFCVLLYKALGDISEQTGFEKGIIKEKRAVSLTVVFAVFTAVRIIAAALGYEVYLKLPLTIFELVWLIYGSSYIYSCYMMIATEEIIDKENKKMREYDEKHAGRMLKSRRK